MFSVRLIDCPRRGEADRASQLLSLLVEKIHAQKTRRLVLRYERLPGEIRPTLTVVKTRGSAHDFGTYCLVIDDRGVRVGARTEEPVPAPTSPAGATEEWAPGVEGDA